MKDVMNAGGGFIKVSIEALGSRKYPPSVWRIWRLCNGGYCNQSFGKAGD